MKIEKLAEAIANSLDGDIIGDWDIAVGAYVKGDKDVTVFAENDDEEFEFLIQISEEG